MATKPCHRLASIHGVAEKDQRTDNIRNLESTHISIFLMAHWTRFALQAMILQLGHQPAMETAQETAIGNFDKPR